MSDFAKTDRIIGTLIGLAAGDALGAGYEFQPRVPYTQPVSMTGGGSFNWAPGEWTDDTSMAYVIAQVAAKGLDLRSEEAQTEIVRGWYQWSKTASDVGIQTRSVLMAAGPDATASQIREIAAEHHRSHGRSGGNGSLMRTAPVALAYLDDPKGLVEAAMQISALTHFDPEAGEACALWCLAIRHAILEGNFQGMHLALDYLPEDRQTFWRERIELAEVCQPWQFNNNGWVIHAFQAAWSAIVHSAIPAEIPAMRTFKAQHFERALERAVRCGNDTDTVAAIAGSLLGARWGASAIPAEWQLILHGYDNATTKDLSRLAYLIDKRKPLGNGWPASDVVDVSRWSESFRHGHLEQAPLLHLGGQSILANRPVNFDAAISLSAVGTSEGGLEPHKHLRIVVKDSSDSKDNPNLAFQMWDVSQVLDRWLRSGQTTLLHCVQAQCRTPSFAAAYLTVMQGMSPAESLDSVETQVPGTHPHSQFVEAIHRLESPWWQAQDPIAEHGEFAFTVDHQLVAALGDEVLLRKGGSWVRPEGRINFESLKDLRTSRDAILRFDEDEMLNEDSAVLDSAEF